MNSGNMLNAGNKIKITNSFELTIFEEIYPCNAQTGRSLYKVRDNKTMLFYALKIFDLSINNVQEIEKEILGLNGADLGSVAPKCRNFSVQGDVGYLLMDWFEGMTLAQRYPLPPEDIFELRERVEVLQNLCFAVEKIHSHKVFHRDLKPENIILPEGRDLGSKIKLIDFGMSGVKRKKGEGTDQFRAPEQEGRRDFNLRAQVDIFSIGIIGWWLITGKIPELYVDEISFTDWDNLNEITLQKDCPYASTDLENTLKTALAYRPEKRYPNARLFGMTLKNCKLKEN